MSDAPDFDDIVGEETESYSRDDDDEESEDKDRDDQMFIKGQWGTKVVRRDDYCYICNRLADLVLIVGAVPDADKPEYDRLILTCEAHEGDIRGDLKYGPNLVQRREF